jgi:hypothetical protein
MQLFESGSFSRRRNACRNRKLLPDVAVTL